MKKVEVSQSVEIVPSKKNIGWVVESLNDGKLVTIPEFLQRTMRQESWFKSDYKNSKEYIVSVFKGHANVDSLTIVPIFKLIKSMQEQVNAENTSSIRKSYQDGLDMLIKKQNAGAEWVCLDGQSRVFLAIKPYIQGHFALGDLSNGVTLRLDGKLNNTISTLEYPKLDPSIQFYFKNQPITVNMIVDFQSFDDIVDILVNKQKGFEWFAYQIVKQKNRFKVVVIDLISNLSSGKGKSFLKYWETRMKSLSAALKPQADGHQLITLQSLMYMENGIWPSKDKWLSKLSDTSSFKKGVFTNFFKYTGELFGNTGDVRITISAFINWIVLRNIIDNPTKQSHQITRDVSFKKRVGIRDMKLFVDRFMKLHTDMYGAKLKHEASYVKTPDGNYTENKEGYRASCTAQDTLNISRRIQLLFEYMDWETLTKDNIINMSDNLSKPTIEEVASYNGWEDLDEQEVLFSELSKKDRSHIESTKNGGLWDLENLVVEDASPNRSRGATNLEMSK